VGAYDWARATMKPASSLGDSGGKTFTITTNPGPKSATRLCRSGDGTGLVSPGKSVASSSGLEENAKSKDRPVQGRTDRESPALNSVTVAKMHAAVPHRNPEMTSKLPLGAACGGHVYV
jgi:hypothetical protein